MCPPFCLCCPTHPTSLHHLPRLPRRQCDLKNHRLRGCAPAFENDSGFMDTVVHSAVQDHAPESIVVQDHALESKLCGLSGVLEGNSVVRWVREIKAGRSLSQWWMVVVVIMESVVLVGSTVDTATVEFCIDDAFNISCSSEEVLMIRAASFGRMKLLPRCLKKNEGDVGPKFMINVTMNFTKECSGARACATASLVAMDKQFSDAFDTSKKGYLEITYDCLKVSVQKPYGRQCHDNYTIPLSSSASSSSSSSLQSSGLLSSSQYRDNSTAPCHAFNIQAEDHEIIHTTFHDWSTLVPSNPNTCIRYGTISERRAEGGGWELKREICGGGGSESFTYNSTSNIVRVSINTETISASRFLLKYEAVGCLTTSLGRPGGSVTQSENRTHVILRCNETSSLSWVMTCRRAQWTGRVTDQPCLPATTMQHENSNGVEVWVMLTVGVVVGVATGLLLLGGIIAFMHHKKKSSMNASDFEYTYRQTAYDPSLRSRNQSLASLSQSQLDGAPMGGGNCTGCVTPQTLKRPQHLALNSDTPTQLYPPCGGANHYTMGYHGCTAPQTQQPCHSSAVSYCAIPHQFQHNGCCDVTLSRTRNGDVMQSTWRRHQPLNAAELAPAWQQQLMHMGCMSDGGGGGLIGWQQTRPLPNPCSSEEACRTPCCRLDQPLLAGQYRYEDCCSTPAGEGCGGGQGGRCVGDSRGVRGGAIGPGAMTDGIDRNDEFNAYGVNVYQGLPSPSDSPAWPSNQKQPSFLSTNRGLTPATLPNQDEGSSIGPRPGAQPQTDLRSTPPTRRVQGPEPQAVTGSQDTTIVSDPFYFTLDPNHCASARPNVAHNL